MSKIAFIFPGQGSQQQGMLQDLSEAHPEVQQTFAIASQALGFDLWDMVQNDKESLDKTENTQPALLASSIAILKVIEKVYGIKADYFAGHSLGEYSALVAAQSLDFADAIKLVRLRGLEMQQAANQPGAMYAILGLDDQQVKDICAQAAQATGLVVSAVNFNSPGQVVIAGNETAAEHASELAKAAGAKRALKLPVSVASHCSLMAPAAVKLQAALEQLKLQPGKVIHNYNLQISDTPEQLKEALVEQLVSPVLWSDSYAKLATLGVTKAIEIGPGKVLTGLGPRITKEIAVSSVNNQASLNDLAEFLK